MPADTIDPPAVQPAPLKIPKLADILKNSKASEPPKGTVGPKGPEGGPTGQRGMPGPVGPEEERPNTRILPERIPTDPLPQGPIPADQDDGSEIDTTIMPNMHPSGKKPGDFAEERRQSKQKRATVDELQKAIDKANADAAALKLELDTERAARQKEKEDLENFRTLADTRKKDVEELNGKYFDTFKPTYQPDADEEIQQAHTSMLQTMMDKLPAFVPKSSGNERLMFENVVRDPQKIQGMEAAMQHYAQAKQQGRADVMDLAVNTVAGLLGAEVTIHGINDPRNQVMTSDDPFFRDVEEAMKRAVPHLGKKLERLNFIRENEPKLATERFDKRQQAIRGELGASFNMSQDQIADLLQKDRTNSVGLFNAILNSSPAFREMANAEIARCAQDLSSVPDQLIMPPLAKNDAISIAEHRKMFNERRDRLSEYRKLIIIGKLCGPMMEAILAERDEAISRADAASLNTNPGDSRPGGLQQPEREEHIETTIMPPFPGQRAAQPR